MVNAPTRYFIFGGARNRLSDMGYSTMTVVIWNMVAVLFQTH